MKQTTGKFLETLRKASGFTQLEVAERLGVSNRTVSSWETDRTAPDLLILPAIADLYGVTVDELLRGERKAGREAEAEFSDAAKRNMRKRNFAKFGTKRLFCWGFGMLGSLIFLAACAVLLYSSAPLWLSVILMVIGACGCVACVILLACFAYSALKAEGLVLKEDYTEENKPYALCVKKIVANSLFWLSLPHILGAIVFLTVFFAAGYYDYSIEMGGVSVRIDYTTPTVTLVCINAFFAIAFFVSGLVLNLTGIFRLGTEGQKAVAKSNGKLLGKIVGFGAIPFAIALIIMAVFGSITPISVTEKVYFEAKTSDEVYRIFQTYETGGVIQTEEDGTERIIVPAGKYFLNFQSEDYVWLKDGNGYNSRKYYDLGNGFYGMEGYLGGWRLFHLDYGVSAEDIVEYEVYSEYLTGVDSFYKEVFIPDSQQGRAVNVANYPVSEIHVESNVVGLDIWGVYELTYDGGVYRYEEIWYYYCTVLVAIIFWSVVGATAIADTTVYFIKRKKTEYNF